MSPREGRSTSGSTRGGSAARGGTAGQRVAAGTGTSEDVEHVRKLDARKAKLDAKHAALVYKPPR
jgi:hypothetical protein